MCSLPTLALLKLSAMWTQHFSKILIIISTTTIVCTAFCSFQNSLISLKFPKWVEWILLLSQFLRHFFSLLLFSHSVVIPWSAARQASLSLTISRSMLKFVSIESFIDAIQPSHPLSPFSFCLQSFQHQGPFQWVGSSYEVASVLELQLQHQSFQWIFRVCFPLGLTGLTSLFLFNHV